MTLYTILAAVATAATALAATSTSTTASNTFNLLALEPTGMNTPSLDASIISADPTASRTTYWIYCDLPDTEFGQPESAPCNHLHAASVTVDPTAMTLTIRRQSQVVDARVPTDDPGFSGVKETFINVTATATCSIGGTTTASCTGHMTSYPVVHTISGNSTWGLRSAVQVETISTAFADLEAHSVPVTITDGFTNLPTTTRTSSTSSSTGGVVKVTGQAQVVLAGVVALAGGVALV